MVKVEVELKSNKHKLSNEVFTENDRDDNIMSAKSVLNKEIKNDE
jgi:hypothetical protein